MVAYLYLRMGCLWCLSPSGAHPPTTPPSGRMEGRWVGKQPIVHSIKPKNQIDKMIAEGYDQWTLEKKYYELEKNFKDTLIQYMPIDRALNFVESIANLKKAFK